MADFPSRSVPGKHGPLAGRTVAQIIPALDAGGAERTTLDITRALVEAGARALVITRGGRLAPEIEAAGGRVAAFPADTKNPLKVLANAVRLAALVRMERVDLLHARSRAPAWTALWAARLCRIPFVTTWHGSYTRGSALKRFYNGVMARGDAVIANSHWTARRILADVPQAASRMVVIHRGTDLTAFDPATVGDARRLAMRGQWGLSESSVAVLVAARLTPWKGHRVMLDALALVPPAERQAVVLIFAGDPQGRDNYAAELDAHAASLGLAAQTVRVGHVADMPAALAAADIVAVPSTQPEAFGRVAVGAQAMAKPVIVADHGAVPETVLAPPDTAAPGRTGWRVPPGDAHALADALRAAMALSPAARAALGARARAHAAHFTTRAMNDATLAVYARVLNQQLR